MRDEASYPINRNVIKASLLTLQMEIESQFLHRKIDAKLINEIKQFLEVKVSDMTQGVGHQLQKVDEQDILSKISITQRESKVVLEWVENS